MERWEIWDMVMEEEEGKDGDGDGDGGIQKRLRAMD